MIKLKNKFKDFLRTSNIQAHKFILKKLLDIHCGGSVSTSGEEARKNNCFWVSTKKDVNNFYGFDRYDEEAGFICKSYIDNQYVDEQTIDENELINLDIEIVHYYKSNRIDIHGVYTFLYSFIIFKLLVIVTNFLGDLSQFFSINAA
ncbi:MAG: hypothetical protein CTY33_01210 [Methylotenera sp.]|nr:MAG: hypothetical protein CTY33_01210 [Methylotenera sp.]